jgi:hypothetical protein
LIIGEVSKVVVAVVGFVQEIIGIGVVTDVDVDPCICAGGGGGDGGSEGDL